MSIGIANDLCALQNDPEIPRCIGQECCHGTNGKACRIRLLESAKAGSVKTAQTFVGSNPEVAVPGLGECGDQSAWKSPAAGPSVLHVLRNGSIRINRMSGQ